MNEAQRRERPNERIVRFHFSNFRKYLENTHPFLMSPDSASLYSTKDQLFSFIQQRIKHALNTSSQDQQAQQQPKALLNFVGNPRQGMPKGLPFNLTDYLQL